MKKIILLCVCPIYVFCQNTYIPDNNFEQKLINLGIDDTLDNYVTTNIINTLSYIDLSNLEITDLTGIQDFTSLNFLYCNDNILSNINISTLNNLSHLNCSNNNLLELDVSNNTEMIFLNCSNNNLSALTISNNTNLSNLYCYNNNILCVEVWNVDFAIQMEKCSDMSIFGLCFQKDLKTIWSENCSKITHLTTQLNSNKRLLKTYDFLGRENTKSVFQINIYNDGTIQKKYSIN